MYHHQLFYFYFNYTSKLILVCAPLPSNLYSNQCSWQWF